MTEPFNHLNWRIIDQSTIGLSMDPKHSFAMDDALCQSVGQGEALFTARTWVHPSTVVLGIQDARLPHLEHGVAYLREMGYQAVVRNSGGLAVILDEGVLNISFILPEKGLSIDDGYLFMTDFIREMFHSYPVTIEDYEIIGSYCPGRYDLSIDGKKIAGISQRRIRGGAAVQIYLCISGSGSRRAEIVRGFYERALDGEQTRFSYPEIKPDTMASLSELLGIELSMNDVMTLFYKTMYARGPIQSASLNSTEVLYYEKQLERIMERNQKSGLA